MAKTKVLFLCTGNSARSQMAEAYLRHYGGDIYEPHSAGLKPKGVNPYTVRVMEERGISLEGQSSKSVDKYLGRVNFGWLITVCNQADKDCPQTFLGVSKRLHWDDLDDPVAFAGSDEETMQKFREVRDKIDQHIKDWIAEQGNPV
ncbi:MAG: arsenate reductase ArsC [Candidatus Promineifilaceae bacterium]